MKMHFNQYIMLAISITFVFFTVGTIVVANAANSNRPSETVAATSSQSSQQTQNLSSSSTSSQSSSSQSSESSEMAKPLPTITQESKPATVVAPVPTLPETKPIQSEANMVFPTVKEGTTTAKCISDDAACFVNYNAPSIFAAKSGVVKKAAYGYNGGVGNYIIIDHGNGLSTFYSKLTELYVKEGQTVTQGEAIGQMGTTGISKSIHLHFEVRLNDVLQPSAKYLPYTPPISSDEAE